MNAKVCARSCHLWRLLVQAFTCLGSWEKALSGLIHGFDIASVLTDKPYVLVLTSFRGNLLPTGRQPCRLKVLTFRRLYCHIRGRRGFSSALA